jgi:hypothetical protein
MIDHADDLIEEALARSRDRGARFKLWLERLRRGDPAFAEPSVLYPRDLSEWQAAVYLLTGCEQVWSVLGADALADRFHWPQRGHGDAVAAHFWVVDRWPASSARVRAVLLPALDHSVPSAPAHPARADDRHRRPAMKIDRIATDDIVEADQRPPHLRRGA